jgi:tetratricopeptide (TPR) repeat protein
MQNLVAASVFIMSKYLIFFLICVSTLGSRAQSPTLDSLIRQIGSLQKTPASLARDTTILLSLSLLTERSYNVTDSRRDAFLDSLGRFSQRVKWPKGIGLYERALGKRDDVKGNYQRAIRHYNKAIELLKKAGGDPYELAYAYILAAIVLRNNGLADESRKYLADALPYAQATKNKNNLCWILDAQGDYYFYSDPPIRNYQKTLYYYLEVEKNLPYTTSPKLRVDNPYGLANIYQVLGNVEKATVHRKKALENALRQGDRITTFSVYSDFAKLAQNQLQFGKAIAYRQDALRFAQQSNWSEYISRAERELAETYKQAGDYKNALHYFEQHQRHEDSLGRFDFQKKYAELQAALQSQFSDGSAGSRLAVDWLHCMVQSAFTAEERRIVVQKSGD